MAALAYEGVGSMQYWWRNPPAPFNSLFDSKGAGRYSAVTASMTADNFYAGHTREECKAEWARRYEALKAAEQILLSAAL